MMPNCKQEQKRLEKLENDTGWVKFDVEDSFTNLSWEPLSYRKIGKVVYIHGGGTLDKSISTNIAHLPEGYKPKQVIQVPCMINAISAIANIKIDFNGNISCLASTAETQTLTITINTSFIARE